MGTAALDARGGSSEFVQARVGAAPVRTLLDCYRELLALCTEHRIERALVISDDGDDTTHAALVQALNGLSAALPQSGFRLALLASSERAFELYRTAEPLAARNGIAARAFRRRAEAVAWLTGRPAGEREAPRP